MSLNKATVVKDSSGQFFLIAPNGQKEKIGSVLSETWEKLETQYEENQTFLKNAGLSDEVDQVNIKKAFEKNFFLESILRGTIALIPIFIGFFIFSYAITGQFTKLAGKIEQVVKPYSEKAAREELGYKKTLERYRPHIYETLKVIKEESQRAEKAISPSR